MAVSTDRSIVVIGSINMDLVCRTANLPRPGETVLGGEFLTIPGGKGANQAVAAARLARPRTSVHMIGRLGDDAFGQSLLSGLRDNGVKTDHVRVTRGVSSGVAMILVDAKGENSIVVASGANAKLSVKDVEAARDLIAQAKVVVMQLEVPLDVVKHAITMCRKLGVTTLLDPAPVPPRGLPRALYHVDVLTPNETEAAMLLKGSAARPDGVAKSLLSLGASRVVLKLGARGCLLADGAHVIRGKAFRVNPVDSTAAGDAFTGALAVALTEQQPIPKALSLANAAGALCCTKVGAQPSLPYRAEVEKLVRRAPGR